MIAYFIESGVTVTNVTRRGSTKALGSYSGGISSNLGIEKGIILSSGDIKLALGPNNKTNAGFDNSQPGDPDMNLLGAGVSRDASVIEFDLIPEGNKLAFNFVFGSEEYPEYVGAINDVFGFVLSGPGISGTYSNNGVNVAVIPGTNLPISINNLNSSTNSQYYINNNYGQFIQYDAYTVVLPIMCDVIPNETYHLKIAIADMVDGILDSGVFLESPSLKSFKKDYNEPFSLENGVWHYTLYEHTEAVLYTTISTVGDTVINNMPCSILLEDDFTLGRADKKYHYMYQRNDSVFFFADGNFHLLYDYGAEAGDTITLGYYTTYNGQPLKMIIDSTSTIMAGGIERKLQYITCGDGMVIEFGKEVIAGIGSTSFMFPTLDFSKNGPLRCYTGSNNVVYHNQFYTGY